MHLLKIAGQELFGVLGVRTRTILVIFFFSIFLLYTFAPRYVGMGHAARYDLTKAIVDKHTFTIDDYVENTIDWAYFGGHYYSNKAPGISFLGVPFYWALTRGEDALSIDRSDWGYRNLRWVDVFITALPSVLLAVILFSFFLRVSALSTWQSLFLVFLYAVGSNAFTFSTMLWGHQTAALFLFLSFYLLVMARGRRASFWSGVLFSAAVLTEYSTALAGPAFLLLCFDRRRARFE